MKNDLGILLVIAGVLCLLVYVLGVQVNALLVISLVLEVAGILAYILFNRKQ